VTLRAAVKVAVKAVKKVAPDAVGAAKRAARAVVVGVAEVVATNAQPKVNESVSMRKANRCRPTWRTPMQRHRSAKRVRTRRCEPSRRRTARAAVVASAATVVNAAADPTRMHGPTRPVPMPAPTALALLNRARRPRVHKRVKDAPVIAMGATAVRVLIKRNRLIARSAQRRPCRKKFRKSRVAPISRPRPRQQRRRWSRPQRAPNPKQGR